MQKEKILAIQKSKPNWRTKYFRVFCIVLTTTKPT